MQAAVLFAVLFLLLILGVPVAFSIALSSISYLIIFYQGSSLIQLPTKMYASNDSYVLLAIPLFIFAGYLMEAGGISKRLIDFVQRLLGRLPGAMGTVSIVTCMVFSALTGSAVATIAAVGSIMYPSMVEAGYKKETAAGIICCAGALGPIIPPSVPMVIYGSTMGVSVADLFRGGIVPGLILGLLFIAANTVYAIYKKLPVNTETYSCKDLLIAFWRSIGVLFLPVLILGGIYGGYVTPTEAATLAVIYSVFLTLVYRSIDLKTLLNACKRTVVTAGTIMTIITISNLFAYILSVENIPAKIAKAIAPYMRSQQGYMIILFLFLVVVGALMDSGPAILILAPIVVPIGTSMGIDPVFLGTMFCVILCAGAITPPFGVGLFTMSSTADLSFGQVVKGALPFMLICFAALFIMSLVPGIPMLLF